MTTQETNTIEPSESTHTISRKEAEEALGITYQTLYRWARSGDISVYKGQGPYGPENYYNQRRAFSHEGW